MLRELIEVLKKENEILESLIECGNLKQQYIIADNVKELDKLLPKEHVLLANLNTWEDKRLMLQEKMADYWQVKREELTADKMLEQVKASFPFFYPEFAEIMDALTANLSFLQRLNRHNNELIEQALQYIETVQVLLEGDEAGVYGQKNNPAGGKVSKPGINLIDKKV
ncbi:flagellar protein FlgN [Thermosyntropha sp.]|uniref:flagellar protein FlgN n=1 Tax=Thermosyntropha sp. TaxID=2740820 RepID=UPI0025DAEEBE|nr:flagellar protein FlgN [Thermosyntropha sp.]